MASLTAPRNTPALAGSRVRELTAGETIYAGGIVSVKAADGLVYQATDAEGYSILGRAGNTVDSGGVVVVERGIFLLDNDVTSGATITAQHIGSGCWVKDDHTVTVASGTLLLGTVWDVNDDGVFVEIN
ncbi:MAG: hypothetical protein VB042_05360 [Victivallaceae bacterium]|nr:hypothetical protein [Victivallaceae bacterium]